MPERHEIAGSDVKNPGFAGRSDGAVSKYRPSAVPPPRALVRKGSLYPFIFSMTVWTVLGVWAYNIFYTKKEEDEDKSCLNDPDYLQKQGFGANTGKKLFQKRTAESKGLLHFEGDNCTLPENVHLQVSVNNEYERFEVIKRTFYGWRLKIIEFENVLKDEEGNFVMDENGVPVRKGNIFEKFMQILMQRKP